MGTRHAIGVRVDGTDKLSYNQFDGHPEGSGQTVLEELRTIIHAIGYDAALDELRTKARALVQKDESATPAPEDFAKYGDAHAPNVSRGTDWYSLLRGDHGSLMKRLNRGVAVENNRFIYASLFCEWAYIANLDDEVLEVYQGFQTTKHEKGRYAAGYEGYKPYEASGGRHYYPCALIATFKLAELPEVLVEALVACGALKKQET